MQYEKSWSVLKETIQMMCIAVAQEEAEEKELSIENAKCYQSTSKAFGCLCTLVPLMKKMEKRDVTSISEVADIVGEILASRHIECIDPEI